MQIFFRHDLKKHFEGKIYECHCGSVSSSKLKFATHQKTHNAEKFTCKVCQKQFSCRFTLKEHWNKNHINPHGTFLRECKLRSRSFVIFQWIFIFINNNSSAPDWSVHLWQVRIVAFKSQLVQIAQLSLSQCWEIFQGCLWFLSTILHR